MAAGIHQVLSPLGQKLTGSGSLHSTPVPGMSSTFLPAFFLPSPPSSSFLGRFGVLTLVLPPKSHVSFQYSDPFWWCFLYWKNVKTKERFSKSNFPLPDNSQASGFTSYACNFIFSLAIFQIQTFIISQAAKPCFIKRVLLGLSCAD